MASARRETGWPMPWFVAQASYHSPDDAGSPEIRGAQRALWEAGVALEGPDSDALTGLFRDNQGRGVHFSGPGLHEHAARWVDKIAPWLEQQLALTEAKPAEAKAAASSGSSRLVLPGENRTKRTP